MRAMVRESWTDERLDDLKATVDEGFEKADQRFESMEGRFESMQGTMERRFDTLQYSILYSVPGIFAAVMAGFVALILAG